MVVMNKETKMKSNLAKIGAGFIWLSVGIAVFVMVLAEPNEIVPLAIAGAVSAVGGLVLMLVGESK